MELSVDEDDLGSCSGAGGGDSPRGDNGGTSVVWRKLVLNGAPSGGEAGRVVGCCGGRRGRRSDTYFCWMEDKEEEEVRGLESKSSFVGGKFDFGGGWLLILFCRSGAACREVLTNDVGDGRFCSLSILVPLCFGDAFLFPISDFRWRWKALKQGLSCRNTWQVEQPVMVWMNASRGGDKPRTWFEN